VKGRRARAGTALFLALLAAHALWTASSSGNPFRFGPEVGGHYNTLTDALLAGRVSLPLTPDPALLQLPDPYDAVANRPYRVSHVTHDLSLYHGRYYLYFGVAPALTLFAPARLLGLRLPQNLAAALALIGAAAALWATLRLWIARVHPSAPGGLLASAAVAVGWCGFTPFLLRRVEVYEVAVGGGVLFASLALYAASRGLLDGVRAVWLALSGLALILAIGSRPTQVFTVISLAGITFAAAGTDRLARASWRRAALAFAVPLAAGTAALLAYNAARFDDPFEFGMRYQLTEWNQHASPLFAARFFPLNARLNLLTPPLVTPEFPFFRLLPLLDAPPPPGHQAVESVAGVMPCAPFVVMALFWLWPASGGSPALAQARRIGLGLLLHGVVGGIVISFFCVASLRYLLDFLPPLLLSALLAWAAADARLMEHPRPRLALALGMAALIAYSAVLNLAIGLTGYVDGLKRQNEPVYRSIESVFAPLQRALLALPPRRYGDMHLDVELPEAAEGNEVLVAANGPYRHDVLCARYTGPDRVVLRFHHRGFEAIRSPAIPITADRRLSLDIAMGSLYPVDGHVLARLYPERGLDGRDTRLEVRAQGQPVLAGTFDFVPAPPSLVTIGRDRFENGQCDTPFHGRVLRVERAFP
jgi:hypothetical protein